MRDRMSSKDKTIVSGLSIQQKFILITSVCIIVLMSLLGYIAIKRETDILYQDTAKQAKVLAETLAIPLINDLIYEKLGLVEEGGLIDNYITGIYNRRDLNLVYIMVLDETGRVISHNDFTEYGKTYTDPIAKKAFHANSTTIQRYLEPSMGHEVLDVATPLSIGKKRWGTLRLGVSLLPVEKEKQTMVRRIILLTLLILAGGFVIILFITRRFIGPIMALAKLMGEVGSGNLTLRAEVKGNDELAMLAKSFNDMLESIREANEKLRRTHERLVQSEKLASMGILASGVAHEINNPLAGMFNCVRMIEELGDNRELREKYLGLLKEGLSRIEGIVGKLLWMARTEQRQIKALPLKAAIDDVLAFLEHKIKKQAVTVKKELDRDFTLYMDPHDLHQVLMNLAINSIQAMSEGGILTFKAYTRDQVKILEVSDTGHGIPEEDIPKVFDPFFTTKPPGEGTGLGLWLTYEIVKTYGGDINIKSSPGKGTTVKIIFPEEHG